MWQALWRKRRRGFRGEALHGQWRIGARTLPTFLLFRVLFAFFSPQTAPNAKETINIDAHAEHTERSHKLLPSAKESCFGRMITTVKWFRESVARQIWAFWSRTAHIRLEVFPSKMLFKRSEYFLFSSLISKKTRKSSPFEQLTTYFGDRKNYYSIVRKTK